MPQDRVAFRVAFHGPVRVGTGRAGRGLDDTVDHDVVVPGSSLKGVMRAEARALFGPRLQHVVDEVFGTERSPSPWHWDDVRAGLAPQFAARIRVDSATGAAVDSGLFLTEHHWPDTATFTVTRFVAVTPQRLPLHCALLAAAALGLTSVGGDRNRGFGWVDVRPTRADGEPLTGDGLDELLQPIMQEATA